MSTIGVMNLDCCIQPSLRETGFGYVTSRGESWKLLRCGFCGAEWVHSTEATGGEGSRAVWYTCLAPTETTPVLKLGPAMDVDTLRLSWRSLRVCGEVAQMAWRWSDTQALMKERETCPNGPTRTGLQARSSP